MITFRKSVVVILALALALAPLPSSLADVFVIPPQDCNDNGLPDDCEASACPSAEACRFPQVVLGPLGGPRTCFGPSGTTVSASTDCFGGPPDDVFLGIGGKRVTFRFDCGFIGDGPGPDFNVYELDSGAAEFFKINVLVSFDGRKFRSVKSSQGPVVRIPGDGAHGNDKFARSYDLSGSGLTVARFVRIDGNGGNNPKGCCSQFDLDAIGVINNSTTVPIVDTTPPLIRLKGQGTIKRQCGVDTYTEEGAVASDNCDAAVSVVIGGDVVNTAVVGTYVVTYDAVDAAGNAAIQVTRTVQVVDTIGPVIASLPANLTIECESSAGVPKANTDIQAFLSAPVANDLCDPVVGVSNNAPDPFPFGATTVIWSAQDLSGNSVTASRTVTVVDTTPPDFTSVPAEVTVTDVDCEGGVPVGLPTATATDICDPAPSVTDDAPATFPAGQTTTVTFTATDADGNTSTATVDVTVLYGADIFVKAAKHTVGSGSHPGSTKEPLAMIQICAYDKSAGSCAAAIGISHQHYEVIVTTCDPVNCAETDENGEAVINLPPDDYIVIATDLSLNKTVLPDPLGVSASDLVCGELKKKHLQQIIKVDSMGMVKKRPGKTTRRTGSELLIIEPEYIIWDGTVQDYPFIFETVGDWGITATVAPPEGFVSDYDSLSADVANEIETVQFTITEVGSDLVPTGTTFDVTHKGRREIIHSKVDIFLTAEYARARGFNVAQLRAAGLIKELPDQAGFGQSHRRGGE